MMRDFIKTDKPRFFLTFNPPPKKTCEVRFTWQHAFGPFRSEWVQMPGRHRAGGRVCWLPFQGYRYLMLQYLFTKYTRNALEVTQVPWAQVVGFDDESSSVKARAGGGALPVIMSIIRSLRNPRLPQLQSLSARYNLIQKKRRKKEETLSESLPQEDICC